MSWDAATKTLTIMTPGGNPRVFTSTPFTPSFSKDHTPTEIKAVSQPVYEKDDVKIQWGKEPSIPLEAGKLSSGAGRGHRSAAAGVLPVLAAAAALLVLL